MPVTLPGPYTNLNTTLDLMHKLDTTVIHVQEGTDAYHISNRSVYIFLAIAQAYQFHYERGLV